MLSSRFGVIGSVVIFLGALGLGCGGAAESDETTEVGVEAPAFYAQGRQLVRPQPGPGPIEQEVVLSPAAGAAHPAQAPDLAAPALDEELEAVDEDQADIEELQGRE